MLPGTIFQDAAVENTEATISDSALGTMIPSSYRVPESFILLLLREMLARL